MVGERNHFHRQSLGTRRQKHEEEKLRVSYRRPLARPQEREERSETEKEKLQENLEKKQESRKSE